MVALGSIKPKSKIAYLAPTFGQARDIAWNQLKTITESIAKDTNESRLEIVLKNGSFIVLRGWESVETLRGQNFDLLVVDEIASMKNWDYNWSEVLRPTLTDTKGQALFISTPKGFNHFYTLFNKEHDKKSGKDYASFHFTSYDNPHLPTEELDAAREEEGEDAFAQEYLADFRRLTGAVCPWWDRGIHSLTPGPVQEWYETIDGGYQDPAAYLLIGISYGSLYVVDGFREVKLGSEEIKERREFILQDNEITEGDILEGWIDSDNPRLSDELNDMGFNLAPVSKQVKEAKSWDEALARKMEQYGRVIKGSTGLYVNPKLEWLIQEIETLTWTENTQGETLPKWDMHRRYKHHYDGIKALAYFLIMFSRERGGIVYWERGEQKAKLAAPLDTLDYSPDEAIERASKKNPFRNFFKI